MTGYHVRLLYVVGIAFNAIALYVSWESGELLFAVTFAIIMVYLAIRYWMVATGTDGT
ncbi:hypothetical protein [Natrarchaeobaculum aegyptiacum]|uniref:hypothetical protein n=1 Tax=Natrarchaeobaculum aegyptiacum TaxID=745377 RepID=UPI0013747A79|nr:hypothetical protein [Natrarchaeobaculum aegyptiacum]